MFICKKCLEENYNNWSVRMNYRSCEICGETKECHDIPSSKLERKEEKYVDDWYYQDGEMKVRRKKI